MMRLSGLVPYTVFIISTAFWLYIFFNNRSSPHAREYLGFLGVTIVWSIIEFYMSSTGNTGTLLHLMRFSGGLALAATYTFFRFTSLLIGMRHRRIFSWVFLATTLYGIIISTATPYAVRGIEAGSISITPLSGFLSWTVAAFTFTPITIITIYCLIRGAVSADRIVRRQVRLIMIGFIPAVLFTVIFNIALPYLFSMNTQMHFVSLPALIITGFIFIAVVRYRFFSNMLPAAARELFLQISDGVILCDRDGTVAAMNTSAEQLLNLSENHLPKPLAAFADGALVHIAENTELNVCGKNCMVTKSSLKQSGQTIGSLIILTDISDRSHMEAALKKSNEELSLFASVISHDVREPLRVISNYLDLLKHRANDRLSADERSFIDGAARASVRLHALIHDLLKYSRTGHDPSQDTDISMNEIFDESVMLCGVAARETNAVITRSELPTLHVSRTLMSQLLQNLLSNALKFRSTAQPIIHLHAECVDDHYRFSMKDNGIGFEQQYSETIFELFKRLHDKKSYSGTGLGLAVCRKIVSLYGGHITADSAPGKGTTIYFSLPAGDSAPRTDNAAQNSLKYI
ncbi:MAG: GHKL domain-containing protein [Spirochaetes bacterium]|nr:GHKL domain-containing protein [Spirochaetota bacterium]